MKKVLITGFSGFVARHLLARLGQEACRYSVLGIDINKPDFSFVKTKNLSVNYQYCNLLDKIELKKILLLFDVLL